MKKMNGLLYPALLAWGFIMIASYRCEILTKKAQDIEDRQTKIHVLKSAISHFPVEARTFYELGKAYFSLGIQKLGDNPEFDEDLRRSVAYFRRSIRLNPFSAFSHFYLAQALLYRDVVSTEDGPDPFEEYRKAALLSGNSTEIFFQVGKSCLARWKNLTEGQRDFALSVLRKVMERRNPDSVRSLFQIWEMNVQDYRVMEMILPDDPRILSAYADFLGGKSLSLEERLRYLNRAEFLNFQNARKELERGEDHLLNFQINSAAENFWSCLKILRNIRFYQNLAREKTINVDDFKRLQSSCWLNLAKCALEEGPDIKKIRRYVEQYLDLENRVSAVNELETHLRDYGLIKDSMNTNRDDFERVALQFGLLFKQNRYRDILQFGRLLQQDLMVVPNEKKSAYIKILQLIGDSYQKVDYLYDAREFHQKAHGLDRGNLAMLGKLRQDSQLLNDEKGLLEVEQKIQNAVSPRDVIMAATPLQQGQPLIRQLRLDNGATVLELQIKNARSAPLPLLSIVFNGKVLWEGYFDGQVLSIPLEPSLGENEIKLVCLNRNVILDKLTFQKE